MSAINPVQALLAQTSLQNTLFASSSRYYGIATETYEDAQGRTVVYLRRRFLPDPASFQVLEYHTVVQGERPDNIAAQYLGDPTLFWRLADANSVMRAEELTETIGARIAITLPQGVTGSAL